MKKKPFKVRVAVLSKTPAGMVKVLRELKKHGFVPEQGVLGYEDGLVDGTLPDMKAMVDIRYDVKGISGLWGR